MHAIECFNLIFAGIVKEEETTKRLGKWHNVGTCYSIGCGPGRQLQHRNCKDGTKSICQEKEKTRFFACKVSPVILSMRNCTLEC